MQSFQSGDAYEIVLPITSLRFEYQWDGVRRLHVATDPSAFNIYDLNPAPSYRMIGAFNKLRLHITRSALDDLADDFGAQRIHRLMTPDGWDTVDPVINGLKDVLLLAFEQQKEMSSLFVDHTPTVFDQSPDLGAADDNARNVPNMPWGCKNQAFRWR